VNEVDCLANLGRLLSRESNHVLLTPWYRYRELFAADGSLDLVQE
jgi:hypothetical protein